MEGGFVRISDVEEMVGREVTVAGKILSVDEKRKIVTISDKERHTLKIRPDKAIEEYAGSHFCIVAGVVEKNGGEVFLRERRVSFCDESFDISLLEKTIQEMRKYPSLFGNLL